MNTISYLLIATSSSKYDCQNQCADSGTDMYHISSCEVNRANLC